MDNKTNKYNQYLSLLLSNIAKKDQLSETAITLLYKELSNNILSFVQIRLSNDDDAQIALSETIYAVWCDAHKFKHQSLVKTWVLGIAKYKVLDIIRKNCHTHQNKYEDIQDYADVIMDENTDLYEELANKQKADWVAVCLEKLSIEHKESLHLLFFEDLSIEEISNITNLPNGTIKTRIFHAKKKIKSCLQRWLNASKEQGVI